MPGVSNTCSWTLPNSHVDIYLLLIQMEMIDDTKTLYTTDCIVILIHCKEIGKYDHTSWYSCRSHVLRVMLCSLKIKEGI